MSNPFNATGDATVANPGATDPTRPPSATDTVANNPRHGDSVGPDTPDGAATDDKTTPTVVAIPTIGAATDDTAATRSEDRATEQIIDAVTHDRQCTLTIGEAQDMFRKLLRRPLSERSLQRYCSAGAILSQLISHSQGKEWLLNETSLIRFIERYPITLTEAPTAITAHAPAAITSTVGAATAANLPRRRRHRRQTARQRRQKLML